MFVLSKLFLIYLQNTVVEAFDGIKNDVSGTFKEQLVLQSIAYN
jgi:hypothetical protein